MMTLRRRPEPAKPPAGVAPEPAKPPAGAAPEPMTPPPSRASRKRPLYPRLLRLRHVHPNAWQRAVLGEGALAVAVLLVLADLASGWTLLALPLAVAAVVKAHDLLAGALGSPPPDRADPV